MRAYSTPESVLKGEITKLAIGECFVCVTVCLAFALYFGTLRHYYMAIALAPLMLLRTDTSLTWTWDQFNSVLRYMKTPDWVFGPIQRSNSIIVLKLGEMLVWVCGMVIVILIPITALILRIVSTVYHALRNPITAVSNMPQNWVRQSLCTDLLHPPELLPGASFHIKELSAGMAGSYQNMAKPIFGDIDVTLFDLALYRSVSRLWALPSYAYRISFKATVIVYAPFVWVVHTSMANRLPLRFRLERIVKGEMEKLRRGLAWLVIALALLKAGLTMGIIDLTTITAKFPIEFAVFRLSAASGTVRWWQVGLLIDAALTFGLLLFAETAMAYTDVKVWRDNVVAQSLSVTSFIRGTLAVATMFYLFYLALLKVVPPPLRSLLMF